MVAVRGGGSEGRWQRDGGSVLQFVTWGGFTNSAKGSVSSIAICNVGGVTNSAEGSSVLPFPNVDGNRDGGWGV